MNSPCSEEDSEIEEARLFQSNIDAKPEIDICHEPLCFNDEDVMNGEDFEQTSALEESQIIPDNETDFGLQENIKSEKEDRERLLHSELRLYEEESSSSEEVRIIKSENPEIISKESHDQHEYRIFPDVDSSFENGNNIVAIDFFLKEKSMFEKPGTIFQECEKILTISEEGNTQHKNIFPDKEANFILGIDINNEVLDENVSLNSELRELKEEESILDDELVNYVINSEKATTSANRSIDQSPEVLVSGIDKGGKVSKFKRNCEKELKMLLREVDKGGNGSKVKGTLRSRPVRSVAYQQRIRKTFGKKIFCRLCNLSFDSNVEKKSHMNLHKRKFECGHCSFECNLKSILKRHEKIHCNVISKRSELGIECNEKRDLKSQALKSGKEKFKCSQCRYETKFKGHMKRHMQRHFKVLQCCECSYKCYDKKNFRKHMLKHWDIKSFKCNDERNVKRRLKKDLVGQGNRKSLKCSKCDYRTNVKASLKRHEHTHTNTKLFKCSYCSYGCNDKRSLIAHKLKYGNGKCSERSYGYSDKRLNHQNLKFKCSE